MTNKKPVTKAIIAAAGFGTRFLPATKNQPKEMLPIIDKPIIHYLVEEAVNSGITDIILVTRFGNHIMEDYFDNRSELENALEQAGKLETLQTVKQIPQMANFYYVRQKNHLPYGNGTPILAAKELLNKDEAFVYMFGDDLTLSNTKEPITKQLINVYEKYDPSAILAVQEVADEDVKLYGTVKYKENPECPYEMEEGFEKLPKGEAPSNMAQFGRFVFTYDVVEEVQKTALGKDNELWVIDILNNLAKSRKKVIAQPIDGKWYTTGDPLRYLQTTIKFALERDDLKNKIVEYMKDSIKDYENL